MKKHKLLFIILLLLSIIISVTVYWQFGNIKALYYSFRYSSDQIDDMDSDNQKILDSVLKENPSINIRPTTDAEDKLHGEGLITDDELKSLIMGQTTVADIFGQDVMLNDDKKLILPDGTAFTKDAAEQMREERKKQISENNVNRNDSSKGQQSDANQTDNSANNGNSSNKSDADDKASAYVAQMYVLRSNFCSRLDSIYSQAVSYYNGISGEKPDKASVAKKFYSSASALEKECDAEVETILSELKSTLESSGQDTSMVSKIREYYNNEKSIKKAQYINMYKNK